MNAPSRAVAAALAAALLLGSAAAQAAAAAGPGRESLVGRRTRLEQVVLPGSELMAAPADLKAPLVLRVLGVWPHGSAHRYDLEWTALEAGRHDLRRWLVRKDGSSAADLPELWVTATARLAPGAAEPNEPKPAALPPLGGYSTWRWVAAGAWVVGLLAILFVGRRRRRAAAAAPPAPPTLADRLRPLVEAVVGGRADVAQQAELERLLIAFWRTRLGLQSTDAAAALGAIRAHAEAGALLRQVEAWLHAPAPPARLDLQALLGPYRSVTAAAFGPAAGAEVRR